MTDIFMIFKSGINLETHCSSFSNATDSKHKRLTDVRSQVVS